MGREDFIAAQKVKIAQGQDAVLETALEETWDESAIEQKASDGTLTQADLDAAVASVQGKLDEANAQIEADGKQIAQDTVDFEAAHKDADEKMAALQASFDEIKASKAVEDGVLKGFQDSKDQLETALAILKGLVFPS